MVSIRENIFRHSSPNLVYIILIDKLIDWLTEYVIDRLIIWFVAWLIVRLSAPLIAWLLYMICCVTAWLIDWFISIYFLGPHVLPWDISLWDRLESNCRWFQSAKISSAICHRILFISSSSVFSNASLPRQMYLWIFFESNDCVSTRVVDGGPQGITRTGFHFSSLIYRHICIMSANLKLLFILDDLRGFFEWSILKSWS